MSKQVKTGIWLSFTNSANDTHSTFSFNSILGLQRCSSVSAASSTHTPRTHEHSYLQESSLLYGNKPQHILFTSCNHCLLIYSFTSAHLQKSCFYQNWKPSPASRYRRSSGSLHINLNNRSRETAKQVRIDIWKPIAEHAFLQHPKLVISSLHDVCAFCLSALFDSLSEHCSIVSYTIILPLGLCHAMSAVSSHVV